MSRPVITMGPTMANPNAFATVGELRAELERVNAYVFNLAFRLHDMSGIAQRNSDRLVVLVKLHQAGDAEGLRAELEDLTVQYLKQVERPEAKH